MALLHILDTVFLIDFILDFIMVRFIAKDKKEYWTVKQRGEFEGIFNSY